MQNPCPLTRVIITLLVLSLLAANGLLAQRENDTRYVGVERTNPDAAVYADPTDWLADDAELVCILQQEQQVYLTGATDGNWVEIQFECQGKTVTGWIKKGVLRLNRSQPTNSQAAMAEGASTSATVAKGSIGDAPLDLEGLHDSIPYPWNRINMADYRMKPGVAWIKVPPPKGGTPIWIPIGGGIMVAGGVVYVLTQSDDADPEPTPLRLQDDQLVASCGQELSFNPLLNDQGEGLRITNVTSTANVDVIWEATGRISVSNLIGNGSVTLTIFVEDSQGKTARQSATILINSTPINVVDDSFSTNFQAPVSGNVLDNDQGAELFVTNFNQPTGGELVLSADGSFNFVPSANFSGQTVFTYAITDRCAQTATATVTITIGEPDCSFSVQIDTTPADCGTTNGIATATVDWPGDYMVNWSNGSTGFSVTELPPGEIGVTITSLITQCTDSARATITEREPNYVLSSYGTPGNCLGAGADILLTTQSPATGPMIILLEGGVTLEAPAGEVSLASLTTILPGTHTLRIYDSSIGESCIETLTVIVPDNGIPPSATPDNYTTPAATSLSGNVLENDQGLVISLTAISEAMGGTLTSSEDGQFTFEPFPDFTGEGGFNYTLTDACGATASASVIINVLPPDCRFTVSISSTAADCGRANGAATVMVSETGSYRYQWSNGSSTLEVDNLPAGNISVTVTDLPNALCTVTANATVAELPATVFGSVTPIGGNCLGENVDCIIDFSVAGTGPVIVTLNDGVPFEVPATMVSLAEFTTLFPGSYQLTAYAAASGIACSATTGFVIPDESPTPESRPDSYITPFQTPLSANVLDNDQGLDLELTGIGDLVGGSIDFNAEGSFTFLPDSDFVGTATFRYTVTDACGSTAATTGRIEVLPPNCTYSVIVETTPTDCGLENGTATANVSETGNYSYRWSDGSTGSTISNLGAGSYSLTVTAFDGQCSVSATGQLSEREPAYVQSLQTRPGDCTGNGAAIELETVSPGSGPLTIILNGETVSGIPVGSVNLSSWFELRPGAFSLSLYDSALGEACSETTTGQIVDSSPEPTAVNDNYITPFGTPVSGNTLDNDSGLTLILEAIFNSVGGTVDFTAAGNFIFTPFPGFNGSGGFTYLATDACGGSVTAVVDILVEAPFCTFSVTVIGTDADCGVANGRAEAFVDESGEYQYSWSDGQLGAAIGNLHSDDYQVTATETTTGCSAEALVTIGEVNDPYITNLQVVEPTCGAAGDIILTLTTNVSPQLPITVVFPGGEVTFLTEPGTIALSDYLPIIAGDYTITVEDPAQGPACAETTSVVIAEAPPAPGIRLLESIPPSSPSAADGALLILIEPFTVPPSSILLNGELWGTTTGEVFTIGDLPSGPYLIQVIDALGCASNEIETFLPFTEGLLAWETLGGSPTLPPLTITSKQVEHPPQEPILTNFTVGTQISLIRGQQRYTLALWQLGSPGLGGQSVQFGVQRGWRGTRWTVFNGPVLGYQQLPLPDNRRTAAETFAYWATDLAWHPVNSAPWCIEVRSAIGRQDAWWWQGALGIKVRW